MKNKSKTINEINCHTERAQRIPYSCRDSISWIGTRKFDAFLDHYGDSEYLLKSISE
ncbi:MAG: hypothetical protein WBG46_03975 [Nonlabens sp.]